MNSNQQNNNNTKNKQASKGTIILYRVFNSLCLFLCNLTCKQSIFVVNKSFGRLCALKIHFVLYNKIWTLLVQCVSVHNTTHIIYWKYRRIGIINVGWNRRFSVCSRIFVLFCFFHFIFISLNFILTLLSFPVICHFQTVSVVFFLVSFPLPFIIIYLIGFTKKKNKKKTLLNELNVRMFQNKIQVNIFCCI